MRIAIPLFVACGVLAGCSGPPTADRTATRTGPHGGPAVPLPDGQGYGEVVIESEPNARKGGAPLVSAYFFRNDLKAPLDALPTAVSVKLMEPGGGSTEFPLAHKPRAKDPAGAARFVSQPVSQPTDPLIGELTVTVGGRNVSLPFSGR